MIRLVHLTRASSARSIEGAGIRGEKRLVPVRGATQEVPRAVYAMPMLPDFATTHQWLRELKRWHGERMVAVHFRVPDDELVLVGRYGAPHASVAASEAVRRVREAPAGAEVIVPRSIGKRDVVAIREVPQLVGWTETPEPSKWSCVCPACLPSGLPDRMRKVRAAYMHALADLRRAGTTKERLSVIGRLDMPLEAARGRLDVDPIARLARAGSADVRREAARLLSYFTFRAAGDPLIALLADRDIGVRFAAAKALVYCAGPVRAAALAHDDDLAVAVAEELALRTASPAVASALEALAKRWPVSAARVARTARALLGDDPEDVRLRERLEALTTTDRSSATIVS